MIKLHIIVSYQEVLSYYNYKIKKIKKAKNLDTVQFSITTSMNRNKQKFV